MVQLSCGVQCSRTSLFILNIIFLLLGLSVLSLGIYVKTNGNFSSIAAVYNITQALGTDTMQWTGTVMIIVGAFTSCLAAFGCLGALRKNRGFLYSYTILLALVVAVEFAAVIVVLKFRNRLWETYEADFEQVFNNAYTYNQTEMIKLIEDLEQGLKCCGVEGPSDYRPGKLQIPLSCFPNKNRGARIFTQGCAVAVANWIWNELPIIAVVLGVVLFIEIFGIISALVLGVAVSHSSSAESYRKF